MTRWVATAVLMLAATGCASWRGAQLYQSGSAALEDGEIEVAIADLSRAAELVPDASEVHNHLGIAWLRAGDERRARRSFERALELDCDNRAAEENLERLAAREAAAP